MINNFILIIRFVYTTTGSWSLEAANAGGLTTSTDTSVARVSTPTYKSRL